MQLLVSKSKKMGEVEKIINLKSNPVQVFKDRVAAIKDDLPADWKKIIIAHYPEYNTIQGGVIINNVFALRGSDVKITEIMERIAKKELV